MVGSEHDIVCPKYILVLYLVCTYMYQVCTSPYLSEHCFSGFRGAQRDANTRLPALEGDESGNVDPCPEDEEFFNARPDAATMEEAIGKFMDGMEAHESDGFKDLHRFVGRLPVPTVNASQAMSHKDALEGGFLPSMTEEEQKRFTPSELLLYKHALEYRYIHVQTYIYLVCTIINNVHTVGGPQQS